MLCLVQTASEKHQLILQCNRHLANPVFEAGMDLAVLTLALRVRLPGFLLLYRDAVQPQALHYRTYRNGHLEFESGEQPHAALEAAIRMNQTARLQSLAGFRETLVMDSVYAALAGSEEPFFRGLRFGPLTETPVKNVAQPLRHYRLEPLTP